MLRYITHPSVEIDPDVDVPHWGLSDKGRAEAQALLTQPWVSSIMRIISSDEAKAVETARILADHLGLEVEVRPATHENDRSSTGFVPPDDFQVLADAFFAKPEVSEQGWERAVDAQARIATELADLLHSTIDVAVVGHGGVGTLWYCHLTNQTIDRRHDQPGQGHYFTVDLPTGKALHPWRSFGA